MCKASKIAVFFLSLPTRIIFDRAKRETIILCQRTGVSVVLSLERPTSQHVADDAQPSASVQAVAESALLFV